MKALIRAALVAALTMTTGCKTATAVEPNAVHLTRLDTVESLIVGTGPVIDAALPMLTQAGATPEEVHRITRARQALQVATLEVIEIVRARLRSEEPPARSNGSGPSEEGPAGAGPDVTMLPPVHVHPARTVRPRPGRLQPAFYRHDQRLPRAPRVLSPTAAREPSTPRRLDSLRL